VGFIPYSPQRSFSSRVRMFWAIFEVIVKQSLAVSPDRGQFLPGELFGQEAGSIFCYIEFQVKH
jgi:hypothetical protein